MASPTSHHETYAADPLNNANQMPQAGDDRTLPTEHHGPQLNCQTTQQLQARGSRMVLLR